MSDVVVIGGGVIGLSLAWELAGQGAAVTVLDQAPLGREASWAGAGILPPGNPESPRTPEQRLRSRSHALWKPLSDELRDLTGIDNGYRVCGGISVGASPLTEEMAAWQDEGVRVESLSPEELRRIEPAVSPEAASAFRLPDLAQIRNPWHLRALVAGCATRNVGLRPGIPVTGFERQGERILAVKTPAGRIAGGTFCLATGAWSAALAGEVGLTLPIEPVRGQIVQLAATPLPFRHVLEEGRRYLVPRPDGCILVGSTEERVGFDKRNTVRAVAELIRFATRLVPTLEVAAVERTWAGLRPGSPDRLPLLGRVPDCDNLFIAAGHFRNGLQMSPATGRVMRQLILGEELDFPLDGLACDRFRGSAEIVWQAQ